jgi:hypothetical protein
VELPLFDQVGEVLRSLTPDELGQLRFQTHRRGIKVWFDTVTAPREHYEAQVLARRHIDGGEGMAVEIGFHAENPTVERNAEAVASIARTEKAWRKILGKGVEIGTFFGADNWRRVSETWLDPDLDDPEFPMEVASRLVDYLEAIEPARH